VPAANKSAFDLRKYLPSFDPFDLYGQQVMYFAQHINFGGVNGKSS